MIKVPKSDNSFMDSQPMPTMPQDMGGMNNELPTNDDDLENGMDNSFDNNIDGNGESTDPKKQIQQLTGKLSQELRNYNNDQTEPDTELNKYVAGMIIPQASKALTGDDKSEIIDKINNNSDSEDEMGGDEPNDNEISNEIPMDDSNPSESKRSIDNIIDEMINSILNDNDKDRYEKKTDVKSKRKNPFISNR